MRAPSVEFFFQSWRVRHINIYFSFVILNSSTICSLFIFFQVGFLHLYLTLLMLLFSYRTTNYHSTYCPGMPQCPWQCQDYHHNILILRNHHSHIIVIKSNYTCISQTLNEAGIFTPHENGGHFYWVKSPAKFWVGVLPPFGPVQGEVEEATSLGGFFQMPKAFETLSR